MKISERCKKQIEDIERIANEFKVTGECEPYDVVLWNRDLESISELYLAYKSLDEENVKLKEVNKILKAANSNQSHEIHKLKKQLTDITILYQEANDYMVDFEESEDRCATLEAENKNLKEKVAELHTIKKSFEVLRALYLGDYENDEPF